MSDPDYGEQHKTVYAHFGLAIYLSQVLEHGLANALVVLDLVPRAGNEAAPDTWPDQVDAFYEAHFKRTLGSLVRRLREVTSVPPHLEELLEKALDRRNWLSHHYFRERATDFLSVEGRDRMITELEEVRELFSAADKALDAVVKPIQERFGYTEELFGKVAEDMRKEAGGEL